MIWARSILRAARLSIFKRRQRTGSLHYAWQAQRQGCCAHAAAPFADDGVGAALLWFGWFGFNAGSALGANGLAAGAFVVTQAAAAAATLSWVGAEWLVNGHPTMLGAASGCIAGLVAITPAAGFVTVVPAVLIGLYRRRAVLCGSGHC